MGVEKNVCAHKSQAQEKRGTKEVQPLRAENRKNKPKDSGKGPAREGVK